MKALFLPIFVAALMMALAARGSLPDLRGRTPVAAPPTTVIASRPFSYRAGGEFLRNGYPEDGPLIRVTDPPPLEIMTFEVSNAEYDLCVANASCGPAEPRRRGGAGNVPVTGVNFEDATNYAKWLSAETGDSWRLPTIAEWAFAAGPLVVDPALRTDATANDRAGRWLASYLKESALRDLAPRPPALRGTFGFNLFGVADLAGPVWEWTSTCHSRTLLDVAGTTLSELQSCGVRIVEGRHRTAMTYFIRDGRSGGCSAGAPPENLGFRLVRQPS